MTESIPQNVAPPVELIQQFTIPVNPLLAKLRVPPEIQRIPSGGILYDASVMNVINHGEIHVHPMLAIDELELKSPDLLFNGEGLSNVLRRCIPEIKNPNDLLTKDVDFLMLVLRKATYGPSHEVKYLHQDCKNLEPKEHSYVIDLNKIIRNVRELDPVTFNQNRQCVVGNDESKYAVTLSPMKFKHMVQMMQSIDSKLTDVERKKSLLTALSLLIVDVDGITDEAQILDFLSQIPITWVQTISEAAESISSFGPTFSQQHKCKDCGQEVDIHININPQSFFTTS